MFSRKHPQEIDWAELSAHIDGFGFRRFYDSFLKLGQHLLGEVAYAELAENDLRMLNDIWAPLDLHESVRGFKGKLALVGNTWRARWKYRHFTDMSWVKALWIQGKGVVLMKHPKLG